MQTAAAPANTIDRAEIPGMIATLCSYESWFGPYHLQTLGLMSQVALAYCQAGQPDRARPLLERVVRDVGRCLGRDHDLRLRAIAALRDSFSPLRAITITLARRSREILECRHRASGPRSSRDALAARRTSLAAIMRIEKSAGNSRS